MYTWKQEFKDRMRGAVKGSSRRNLEEGSGSGCGGGSREL
jgi:hypothetical protein